MPELVEFVDFVSPNMDWPNQSFLIDYIENQIFEQNSNFVCLVGGLPGKGKSVTSMGLCERYSLRTGQPFSVEWNVVHSVQDLVGRLAELQELFEKGENVRGVALLFDDAGVSMDNRAWQDELHKILNDSLEVMRYLGVVLFVTAPAKDRIDKKLRDLAHATLDIKKKVEGEYTLCKFYLSERHFKTGDYIPVLLKARHGSWNYKIQFVKIRPCSAKLKHSYERWMQEFKGNIIKLGRNRLNQKSLIASAEKQPLTDRQKEIYFMAKTGLGCDSIAVQLGIGEPSVKLHLGNIRRKGYMV